MKQIKRWVLLLAGLLLLICVSIFCKIQVMAAGEDAVSVVRIDYEANKIKINPNGNDKVYYSDSKKKTWSEVEGGKDTDGCLTLDISWVSLSKEYELNLKGDTDESVINVVLPARNSKLRVKFDKLSGTLVFTNEEGAEKFCWRKDNASVWSDPISVGQSASDKDTAAFLDEIEKLRVKGGKIYVKTPQTPGTLDADGKTFSVGVRQSKEVKVSITKRSKAPTVKINGNKLQVNSKDTMEYMVITGAEGATAADAALGKKGTWTMAEKNMRLAQLVPKALYASGSTAPEEMLVAFRTAATERQSYSKTFFLTVPAQAASPKGSYYLAENSTESILTIDATSANPMQYVVVGAADVASFDQETAKWKSVTSSKKIKIKEKKYPAGSVVFVRDKFKKQTATSSFCLPSYYAKLTLSYGKTAEAEKK